MQHHGSYIPDGQWNLHRVHAEKHIRINVLVDRLGCNIDRTALLILFKFILREHVERLAEMESSSIIALCIAIFLQQCFVIFRETGRFCLHRHVVGFGCRIVETESGQSSLQARTNKFSVCSVKPVIDLVGYLAFLDISVFILILHHQLHHRALVFTHCYVILIRCRHAVDLDD